MIFVHVIAFIMNAGFHQTLAVEQLTVMLHVLHVSFSIN